MSSVEKFTTIFAILPAPLVKGLEKSFNQIQSNFAQRRFEPSELNGGKFSEVVLRILEWHTSTPKSYTPFGTKIRDFGQATRRFESMTTFPDSVRFHIPKILTALYDIRNKRGVGHMGGDVDPNHMDSLLVVNATSWILAELVRIFHNLTTSEAQAKVEGLIVRRFPVVWEVGGRRRVLNPNLRFPDKTLLLLYDSYPKSIRDEILCQWTEYSNPTMFRSKILKPLHKKKLLEYDSNAGDVFLSPLGVKYVETNVKLEI